MKAKLKYGVQKRFSPVAVVDIGSNSVRLVVYDGLRRAPSPVFNEKLLCGLGRGVSKTGNLSPEGIEQALPALRRFRALCRQMKVTDIFAVATAAAREADNGPAFIKDAERAVGCPIKVLTGKQEAAYAANAVLSGIPGADGVVGDLGGGSLELIDVKDGKMRDGVTLPLGSLRLIDASGGSIAEATEIVDAALSELDIIRNLKGRTFYAVGGAWRNLARLHMAQNHHPLRVIHQYSIPADSARSVANLVSGLSPSSVADISSVSKSRSETLPFGAMVLDRVLVHSGAARVETSVLGVREGVIFSKLTKKRRESDPLLASCLDFARRYARSPDHELELCDWTDRLFESGLYEETDEQRRLRHAACLLADIGWKAHPDYRGSRSMNIISQAAFVGIDHPGRIFLALTIYFRYEGINSSKAPKEMVRLIDEDMLERASAIAGALRLAYVLSAAMPQLLPKISLLTERQKILRLTLPKKLSDLMGAQVTKRLDQLAGVVGKKSEITIE